MANQKPPITDSRKIINFFVEQHATIPEMAISKESIVIGIDSQIRDYYLRNFAKDGYLVETEKDMIWFNQDKWDKAVRLMAVKFFLIMTLPIVVLVVIFYSTK